MNIGIVGAGASGMIAAIVAARNGAKVTIIEHMSSAGKKLLLTGSGKCNISNSDMSNKHFHSSNDSDFIASILEECPSNETLSFLRELGLIIKDRNGYYYPYNEKASTVLDVLMLAIRDLGIDIIYNCNIQEINIKHNNGLSIFDVKTNRHDYNFDKLIICCGSKAYPSTGSDGTGYEIAKNLGHTIIKPRSALTYLECEESFFKNIAGIRISASIALIANSNEVLGTESGELQITKSGISGIPVFNLSYLAANRMENDKISCVIDFVPAMHIIELCQYIKNKVIKYGNRPLNELLVGLFGKELSKVFVSHLGYKLNLCTNILTDDDIVKLASYIKNFKVSIKSCGGFDNSQVLSGGIDTNELNKTMESKIVDNLYFAGEIIDVIGDCGGYNLTWAFCTGMIAGRNASK